MSKTIANIAGFSSYRARFGRASPASSMINLCVLLLRMKFAGVCHATGFLLFLETFHAKLARHPCQIDRIYGGHVIGSDAHCLDAPSLSGCS